MAGKSYCFKLFHKQQTRERIRGAWRGTSTTGRENALWTCGLYRYIVARSHEAASPRPRNHVTLQPCNSFKEERLTGRIPAGIRR